MYDVLLNFGVGNRQELFRELSKIASDKRLTIGGSGATVGDKFVPALGRIKGELGEFEKSLAASNARVLAFGASAGAVYAVNSALKDTVRAAINVEQKLAEIATITGTSTKSLGGLGDRLFEIANTTGQSFNEAAKAAYELSRQGFSLETTLKKTADALLLVRTSGLSAEEAVSALTAVTNSFTNAMVDSNKLVNQFAAVDQKFAVSSADLAEGFKRVGSTASDAGVSIEQMIALITSAQHITSRGGAVIGNAFKAIFTRLERPKVLDSLEAIGVAIKNLDGTARPVIGVLGDLAEKFDTLSDAQQSHVAELVGGVYQMNILKAALRDVGKDYSFYTQALHAASAATDEAQQRSDELNKTLSSQLNKTLNNLTKIGASFGTQAFGPAIRKIFNSITDVSDTDLGGKVAGSFLSGIGKVLSGPGLSFITLIFAQLAKRLVSFVGDAVSQVAGLEKGRKNSLELEKQISFWMSREKETLDGLLAGTLSISQAQERFINYLRESNILMGAQKTFASEIAESMARIGFTGGHAGATLGIVPSVPVKTKAAGHIPSEIVERAGALAGGYTPGNVKSMMLEGRKVVYNDAEQVIPVRKILPFAKSNSAFIIPPSGKAREEYNKNLRKHNIDPRVFQSGGFMPNLAGLDVEDLGGDRTTTTFHTSGDELSPNPHTRYLVAQPTLATLAKGGQKFNVHGLKPDKAALLESISKSGYEKIVNTVTSQIYGVSGTPFSIAKDSISFPSIQGYIFEDSLHTALQSPALKQSRDLPRGTPTQNEDKVLAAFQGTEKLAPGILSKEGAEFKTTIGSSREGVSSGQAARGSFSDKLLRKGIDYTKLRNERKKAAVAVYQEMGEAMFNLSKSELSEVINAKFLKDFKSMGHIPHLGMKPVSMSANELQNVSFMQGLYKQKFEEFGNIKTGATGPLLAELRDATLMQKSNEFNFPHKDFLSHMEGDFVRKGKFRNGLLAATYGLEDKVSPFGQSDRRKEGLEKHIYNRFQTYKERGHFADGFIPNAAISLSSVKKIVREAKDRGIVIRRTPEEDEAAYSMSTGVATVPKGVNISTALHELGHGLSSLNVKSASYITERQSSIPLEVMANKEILRRLQGQEAIDFRDDSLDAFKTYKNEAMMQILTAPMDVFGKMFWGDEMSDSIEGSTHAKNPEDVLELRKRQSRVIRKMVHSLGPEQTTRTLRNAPTNWRKALRARYFAEGYVPNLKREKNYILRSSQKQGERNIDKVLKSIGPEDKIKRFARAYEDYHNISKKFSSELGVPIDTFANMAAAISPSNPIERNLVQTAMLIKGMQEGINPKEISISSVHNNKRKAIGIFKGTAQLTGQKSIAFADNILNPFSSKRATVDFRAASVYDDRLYTTKTAPQMVPQEYRKVEQAYTNVGKQHGLSPLQVQSATWMQHRQTGKDTSMYVRSMLREMYQQGLPKDYKTLKNLYSNSKNIYPKSGLDTFASFAKGHLPNLAEEMERIRAAAIQMKSGKIHTGRMHWECRDTMTPEETYEADQAEMFAPQQFGFQTNLRPFVSRREASMIASRANQMNKGMYSGSELDSLTLDKSKLAASSGYMPSLHMLSSPKLHDAVSREIKAGYNANQVKVGYDDRVGPLVYNTTEGSAKEAVNLHLQQGESIGTIRNLGRYKSSGHVPNLADDDSATPDIALGLGLFLSQLGPGRGYKAKQISNVEGEKGELEKSLAAEKLVTNNRERIANVEKQIEAKDKILLSLKNQREKFERVSSTAFKASFATPFIAGAVQPALSGIGPNAEKVGKGLAALGDAASYASQIIYAVPGPVGIAIGGAIGSLALVSKGFHAIYDKSPALEKALSDQKDSFAATNDAINNFASVFDKLTEAYRNQKTSAEDIAKLNQQYASALAEVPAAYRDNVASAVSAEDAQKSVAQALEIQAKKLNQLNLATALSEKIDKSQGAFFDTSVFSRTPEGKEETKRFAARTISTADKPAEFAKRIANTDIRSAEDFENLAKAAKDAGEIGDDLANSLVRLGQRASGLSGVFDHGSEDLRDFASNMQEVGKSIADTSRTIEAVQQIRKTQARIELRFKEESENAARSIEALTDSIHSLASQQLTFSNARATLGNTARANLGSNQLSITENAVRQLGSGISESLRGQLEDTFSLGRIQIEGTNKSRETDTNAVNSLFNTLQSAFDDAKKGFEQIQDEIQKNPIKERQTIQAQQALGQLRNDLQGASPEQAQTALADFARQNGDLLETKLGEVLNKNDEIVRELITTRAQLDQDFREQIRVQLINNQISQEARRNQEAQKLLGGAQGFLNPAAYKDGFAQLTRGLAALSTKGDELTKGKGSLDFLKGIKDTLGFDLAGKGAENLRGLAIQARASEITQSGQQIANQIRALAAQAPSGSVERSSLTGIATEIANKITPKSAEDYAARQIASEVPLSQMPRDIAKQVDLLTSILEAIRPETEQTLNQGAAATKQVFSFDANAANFAIGQRQAAITELEGKQKDIRGAKDLTAKSLQLVNSETINSQDTELNKKLESFVGSGDLVSALKTIAVESKDNGRRERAVKLVGDVDKFGAGKLAQLMGSASASSERSANTLSAIYSMFHTGHSGHVEDYYLTQAVKDLPEQIANAMTKNGGTTNRENGASVNLPSNVKAKTGGIAVEAAVAAAAAATLNSSKGRALVTTPFVYSYKTAKAALGLSAPERITQTFANQTKAQEETGLGNVAKFLANEVKSLFKAGQNIKFQNPFKFPESQGPKSVPNPYQIANEYTPEFVSQNKQASQVLRRQVIQQNNERKALSEKINNIFNETPIEAGKKVIDPQLLEQEQTLSEKTHYLRQQRADVISDRIRARNLAQRQGFGIKPIVAQPVKQSQSFEEFLDSQIESQAQITSKAQSSARGAETRLNKAVGNLPRTLSAEAQAQKARAAAQAAAEKLAALQQVKNESEHNPFLLKSSPGNRNNIGRGGSISANIAGLVAGLGVNYLVPNSAPKTTVKGQIQDFSGATISSATGEGVTTAIQAGLQARKGAGAFTSLFSSGLKGLLQPASAFGNIASGGAAGIISFLSSKYLGPKSGEFKGSQEEGLAAYKAGGATIGALANPIPLLKPITSYLGEKAGELLYTNTQEIPEAEQSGEVLDKQRKFLDRLKARQELNHKAGEALLGPSPVQDKDKKAPFFGVNDYFNNYYKQNLGHAPTVARTFTLPKLTAAQIQKNTFQRDPELALYQQLAHNGFEENEANQLVKDIRPGVVDPGNKQLRAAREGFNKTLLDRNLGFTNNNGFTYLGPKQKNSQQLLDEAEQTTLYQGRVVYENDDAEARRLRQINSNDVQRNFFLNTKKTPQDYQNEYLRTAPQETVQASYNTYKADLARNAELQNPALNPATQPTPGQPNRASQESGARVDDLSNVIKTALGGEFATTVGKTIADQITQGNQTGAGRVDVNWPKLDVTVGGQVSVDGKSVSPDIIAIITNEVYKNLGMTKFIKPELQSAGQNGQ